MRDQSRNKKILAEYRALRSKKIRQYDALDIINEGLEHPLEYSSILHIITETARNERQQQTQPQSPISK